MAGSRRWFNYTTDAGDTFGMEMDEDMGEIVGNTNVTGTTVYSIPGNIEPRYALFQNQSGTSHRKIILSAISLIATLIEQIVITATNGEVSADADDNTFNLSFISGEKVRRIKTVDTGMVDGDTTES